MSIARIGTAVAAGMSAVAALDARGLNFQIEQWPLTANRPIVEDKPESQPAESHVLNVRSDTKKAIAVVGRGYHVIQNEFLARLADGLAMEGDIVKVDMVGSNSSGSRIWFLLKGESFSVRHTDTIEPYILLANAHDTSMALRAVATSKRPFCQNMLNMILRQAGTAGYTFRHTSSIQIRVEEIRLALGLYTKAIEATRPAMEALSHKEINREQVQAFFLEAYSRDFGPIAANPADDTERRHREKSQNAFLAFSKRWDDERKIAGTTLWNAFNSYTGFLQHDRDIRAAAGMHDEVRVDNRLFGKDADRSSATFKQALALV